MNQTLSPQLYWHDYFYKIFPVLRYDTKSVARIIFEASKNSTLKAVFIEWEDDLCFGYILVLKHP
jgi:hypothetical protein